MANDDIFFENDVIIDVELENAYIIDQGAITKVVARKYNSESAYDIGDYAIYRNELYKCIANISTPEEFDPTKWTKLFVVDELKNIYSILPTKADKSTTYTKTETDNLLDEKADKSATYTKIETDTLLNAKADKSTTYTKTDTDTLLNTKADKSTTYTKTDTDTLLNTKADKSTTYTKTEVDTALANKANSADVYTKTETYSKTEVDTDIYKKTETYSKTEVDNKIDNLPTPMQFKGTLGTGGTVTDLPTASISNNGFTYKVITDGTYAGISAKVGDMFTSNGSEWVHIPSGDETFTDTWRGIKVNGAEKLGSSINTGSVDFKNGTNSTAVFDPSDSSIKFNVDGYTQAQVDAKLADKANVNDVYAKSETYSQAEVDSKLLVKADSSDVYTKQETYTKTEVNTALSEKADTSAVTTALSLKADKADTYTKEEVDDKFDEIDPIGTASGRIATFETNLADELQSLKCEIVATGGNGTPDNPIPIVGHSELNLTRCGINLWDEQTERGNIDTTTGEKTPYNYMLRSVNYIKVSPNTTLYTTIPWIQCYFYDANKTYISYQAFATHTINVPNNAEYMLFRLSSDYGTTYNNDISINYPATDTEYHAYNGTPYLVQFGQTVYGGVYDKSGRLTITWGAVDLGALDWSYNGGLQVFYTYIDDTNNVPEKAVGLENVICSIYQPTTHEYADMLDGEMRGTNDSAGFNIKDLRYSDTATFKTAMDGIILAYELATPIEIDVPSISVFAENGVNNIVSDCGGDVEVKYFKGMAEEIEEVFKNSNFVDLSDIPDLPNTDGSYRLNLTITDGVPVYSWEKIT